MRSLSFWLTVTRFKLALTAAVTTYVSAVLSDGNAWIDQEKVAASLCIMLGVVGVSLYHFGASHDMYARKEHDYFEVSCPRSLCFLGALAMAVGVVTAWWLLPRAGLWVALFDVISGLLYTHFLSRHWITKNILIAAVCTTPIILGVVIGDHVFPPIPWVVISVFCAYFAREILKDIDDRKANHGYRVTLPIVLGVRGAQAIAMGFCVLSVGFLLCGLAVEPTIWSTFVPIVPLVAAVVTSLLVIAALATMDKDRWKREEGLIALSHQFIVAGFFVFRLFRG